jgi:predicted nucleotidyltransferase
VILEPIPKPPPMAPVIRLDPGRQTEIKQSTHFCFHRQYEVDESTHTVACGSCGIPLDAFEILLDYAQRERSWRYYENEITRAKEALAELKAEERKVKARTRNASRKEAEAAVAEERVRSEKARREITEKARDIGQLCRRIEQLARVEMGK